MSSLAVVIVFQLANICKDVSIHLAALSNDLHEWKEKEEGEGEDEEVEEEGEDEDGEEGEDEDGEEEEDEEEDEEGEDEKKKGKKKPASKSTVVSLLCGEAMKLGIERKKIKAVIKAAGGNSLAAISKDDKALDKVAKTIKKLIKAENS